MQTILLKLEILQKYYSYITIILNVVINIDFFEKKDKILLATGNAISILDFLDLYDVKYYKKREVHDVDATTSLCKGHIVGFQNTEYLIDSTKNIIFNINEGIGNKHTMLEGFMYKNFYATSIIGPILARNDNLNNYFIDLIKKTNKN